MNIGFENEFVEFKSSISQLDKGILGLTAMINRSNRGTVYFGVDDRGDVIGMDIGESTIEKIRNLIRDKVQPRIFADIEVMQSDDGKRYIAVHSSGFDVPYSYDERYYIRHAASNESASPDIVAKLVLSRNFDSARELESYVEELSFTTLGDMMVARGLHPRSDASYYNSIGLKTKGGKFNLNAFLVSDNNNIMLQVVEFAGESRTSFLKRTDYGSQCLFMGMRNVLDSIRSRNEVKLDVSSGIRKEVELFDFECFREAWVNACIHNAWRTMVPPSVSLFCDRIEIQSTGGIPYRLPISDLYEGRSMPVNESLFRLSTMLGFSEHTGRGIPKIVERYGRDSVRIADDSVTIVIPYAFKPTYVIAREGPNVHEIDLSEKERKVLYYLVDNPHAKIAEIAEHIDSNVSAVKRIMSILREKELLIREGTNRNAKWIVKSFTDSH